MPLHLKSIQIFIFTFLIALTANSQSCLPKGPLKWITKENLATDFMAEYDGLAVIKGILFSPEKIDSLRLQLTIKEAIPFNLTIPLSPLSKQIKLARQLPFDNYYVFLLSPKQLDINNPSQVQLCSFLTDAAETGKPYLVIDYSSPDFPSIHGCIAIDLRSDSNKYRSIAIRSKANKEIPLINLEILAREDSILALNKIRQNYWTKVLNTRDKLEPIRDKMEQLPRIQRKALLDIVDLLDNITYAKQQLSSGLIDDESRVAYLYDSFAEQVVFYKNLPPNEKAINLLAIYSEHAIRLQELYFSISEMQRAIKFNKLRIKDLTAKKLLYEQQLKE